jgi:riboflavin kinase/FMN adenylyltransferase
MRLRRGLAEINAPLALAIGNFDGVHLGHQAILAATRRAGAALNARAAAMTFSPLPREYFAKHGNAAVEVPPRLMSVTEKLAAFQRAGMADGIFQRFDASFAGQPPQEFLATLQRANVRWLMVGEDFRFGAKRTGDVDLLRDFGRANGMAVDTMHEVRAKTGERISSSVIREALAAGRLSVAAAMLGRPYDIVGRVTHGKKLGRTLGYPTANIALSGRKPALAGVFAVKCRLVTRGLEGVAGDVGMVLNGVANLGTNPVVSSENRQHLEVFLFDFSGDLYGKRVQVSFVGKIRDEQYFASLDALVTQMHDDTARAKKILSRMNDDGSAKEGLQDHP